MHDMSGSFADVQVVAGHPLAGHSRGLHVLNALQSLGPIIHASLPEMWDGVLPKLCQHLEGPDSFTYSLQRQLFQDAAIRRVQCSVIFVLIYFLVLVLVLVFQLFFRFSFVLVFVIFSF